jgi:hypothetical protein
MLLDGASTCRQSLGLLDLRVLGKYCLPLLAGDLGGACVRQLQRWGCWWCQRRMLVTVCVLIGGSSCSGYSAQADQDDYRDM